MKEQLIRAAIAGMFRQTAELIPGAHDHATLRLIVTATAQMAEKFISISEASRPQTKEQSQGRVSAAPRARPQ